jgi:hypothetical protein
VISVRTNDSGDSKERSDFKRTNNLRFAYLKATFSFARSFGKSWSLASFLRLIRNLRKRDRYFDTGESGETYDAEMEAAAGIYH